MYTTSACTASAPSKKLKNFDIYPVSFHTNWYLYDFGCEVQDLSFRKADLMKFIQLKSCNNKRNLNVNNNCAGWRQLTQDQLRTTVMNSGWHLSWFLSREDLHNKLKSAGDTWKDTKSNHNDQYINCLISKCIHFKNEYYGIRLNASELLYVQSDSFLRARF